MNFISRFAALAAMAVISLTAFAGETTRADAQAMAEAAVSHVKKAGTEQAAKDFNSSDEWKAKGINVNFMDMKGYVLASSLNERLRGKQTLELKDPTGKEFVKEFVATAQKGEGWVDYQFMNPESKKLEPRAMFVRRVPNTDTIIAVAISK